MTLDTQVMNLTKKRIEESYAHDLIRGAIIFNPRINDYEKATELIYQDLKRNPEGKPLLEQAVNMYRECKQLSNRGIQLAFGVVALGLSYVATLESGVSPESYNLSNIVAVAGAGLTSLSLVEVFRSIHYQTAADKKFKEVKKYLSSDIIRQVYSAGNTLCCRDK